MKQLSDQFIQEWCGQLNSPGSKKGNNGSNKLRTYKLFKETFQLENYLLHQIPNKHPIALTKLRVSCYKLAMKRVNTIAKPAALPVNQRLCSICNITEDEVHLVSDCVRNANL